MKYLNSRNILGEINNSRGAAARLHRHAGRQPVSHPLFTFLLALSLLIQETKSFIFNKLGHFYLI